MDKFHRRQTMRTKHFISTTTGSTGSTTEITEELCYGSDAVDMELQQHLIDEDMSKSEPEIELQ